MGPSKPSPPPPTPPLGLSTDDLAEEKPETLTEEKHDALGNPPTRYGTHPGTPYPVVLPPPAVWASDRFWRRAIGGGRAARPGVLAGVVAVAVLAGATLPAPVAGLQWTVLVAAMAAVVVHAARRPLPGADRMLLGLVLALGAVSTVRTSAILALCLLAALGLGGLLATGGRSWPSVLATPLVLLVAALRGLPWAWFGLRRWRWPAGGLGWVRGLGVTVVVVWVCGALLASADSAFAALLRRIVPHVDLGSLPVRVAVGTFAAWLAVALAFAAAVPPRWPVLRHRRRFGQVAEWLLPVVAVDALLTAFLAVQAAELFDAHSESLVHGDATPAERAQQGFGQLVMVTLIVALLLGWAARRCDRDTPRHGRLLLTAGGTLLLLVLVLVGSALRRLWLYEEAFGWTVLRLNVGVFELWLGVVILLAGVAWLVRRTAAVPRLVVASAAAVLLGLGLASPDAVVGSWNVDRFERTGKIDLDYARRLSDDAVPALARLTEPQRSCALAYHRMDPAPWYAVNVSRLRARAVLRSLPAPSTPCP
jgi:hypothetical protein